MMVCDLCNNIAGQLEPLVYGNGDKLMVCMSCFNTEAARGDMEYERMKDDYDPDDPGHERS
jgi:hypothetical protein